MSAAPIPPMYSGHFSSCVHGCVSVSLSIQGFSEGGVLSPVCVTWREGAKKLGCGATQTGDCPDSVAVSLPVECKSRGPPYSRAISTNNKYLHLPVKT